MKLLWHIARKDLVRLRWLALGWVALQITTLLLAWILRDELFGHEVDDVIWGTHFTTAVITGLMAYLLTGTLLQEDPFTSPLAFCSTRPISRARLLGAKVLGVAAVFWLLPALIKLPWWLLNHYGVREIAWAAIETVVISAVVTLPAFLLASVTKDLAQFYRWTFGALALAVLIFAAWLMVAEASKASMIQTRWRLIFGVGGLVCAGIAAFQIFTRRRATALLLAGVGLPLVLVRFTAWPNTLFAAARTSTVVAPLEVLLRDVRISSTQATPALEFEAGAAAESDVFAWVTSLRGTLRIGQEDVAVDWKTQEREPVTSLEWITRHGTRGQFTPATVPLALSEAQRRRLHAEPVSARLSAEGLVWQAEDAMELPLRVDANAWQGTRRLWIQELHREERNTTRLLRLPDARDVTVFRAGARYDAALHIRVCEVVPLLAVDGAQMVIENDGVLPGRESFYLLVNRRRNEIIRLPTPGISSVRSGTVGINTISLELKRAPVGNEAEAFTLWLAEASLVKIVLRAVGAFGRTVEIPQVNTGTGTSNQAPQQDR